MSELSDKPVQKSGSDVLPIVMCSDSIEKHSNRHVIWFSCGAASAVTAHIVQRKHPDALLVRCWLGGESSDNDRFAGDVERWLRTTITILRSRKYKDHFDVIEKTRWINGVGGARCTGELKKKLRFEFQRADDIQYFGYTVEPREQARAERLVANFPEINACFPLIERRLTKEDCVGIIRKQGIEVPAMYRRGYHNNNCIGCVKGGKGYWNKIRVDFPQVFERMANLEREVGATCIKGVYLDELDPKVGRHEDFEIRCDFNCENY